MAKLSRKTQIINSLIAEFGTAEFTYTDISRTAYETKYGIGTFDPKVNRSYFNCAFTDGGVSKFWHVKREKGYLRRPTKNDQRFIERSSVNKGKYYIPQ